MSCITFVASLYQQLRNKQSLKENPKIQYNQVLFNIRVKPKPKSKAYAVKSDDGEKPEFPISGETDKKASHEKPKRTNIQNAVSKTNRRKTKMSNNPILDFNPVK